VSDQLAVPGELIPDAPMMKKQTYASPMSYIGSARRIWSLTRRWGSGNPVVAGLAWLFMALAIPTMWTVVTVWYFVTLLLFSWLLFPFRIIRRSHRKQEQLQRQQLATMQAMMIQQQQALQQSQKND